jgi:hypothetical protein
MNKPKPQEIYRHFKGKLYQIITLAKHSETDETLVIYQALHGSYKVYARPLESFLDGEAFRAKYSDAGQQYRFVRYEPESETAKPLPIPAEIERKPIRRVVEKQAEPELLEVDPLVMKFISVDTHEERLEILSALQSRITDSMIDTMAVSLDLEIADGEVEKRFDELRHCLLTMRKFETNR